VRVLPTEALVRYRQLVSRRSRVISVIMGGGRGSRLHPLTRDRAKPAVPLAGMYRLVDIPISNCLNSGLNQIFLLTQFNTASLHRHVRESYRFDQFGGGYVEILAAEQTEKRADWYQGTADAVRQTVHHMDVRPKDLVLILSGDQLYRMDYGALIEAHQRTGARVTVAATPVPEHQASSFGLMRVRGDLGIEAFVEKPTDASVVESLFVPPELRARIPDDGATRYCLGSMGIYLFDGQTLLDALENDHADFGHEVIPALLGSGELFAYMFNGYWEDIGTVAAFFEANLSLTDPVPPFNFFDAHNPIYTRARYLPSAKVNACDVERAIIAPGCIVSSAKVYRSVIGIRAHIREKTTLHNCVVMGSQWFETDEERDENARLGRPNLGIGRNVHIENAIVDVNARIGDDVTLSPAGKPEGYAHGPIVVRDGVLVVTRSGVVPDGTSL